MPAPDPALNVTGTMGSYDVPDLASVDKWIRQVVKTMRKIEQSGKYPELPAKYSDDIDLLLARRLYLMMTLEETPC